MVENKESNQKILVLKPRQRTEWVGEREGDDDIYSDWQALNSH